MLEVLEEFIKEGIEVINIGILSQNTEGILPETVYWVLLFLQIFPLSQSLNPAILLGGIWLVGEG
jgi:hypothetical protein